MPDTQEEKLEVMLESFAKAARESLRIAQQCGAIPDEWLADVDDFRLQKAVLDSLCRDRPFKAPSPTLRADFENLHIML